MQRGKQHREVKEEGSQEVPLMPHDGGAPNASPLGWVGVGFYLQGALVLTTAPQKQLAASGCQPAETFTQSPWESQLPPTFAPTKVALAGACWLLATRWLLPAFGRSLVGPITSQAIILKGNRFSGGGSELGHLVGPGLRAASAPTFAGRMAMDRHIRPC